MVSIQWNWWNFRCKHGRESINSVLKWLSDCWWLNVSDQILASVVVLPLILLLENIVPYFYWKVLNPSLCWEWTLYWAEKTSDAVSLTHVLSCLSRPAGGRCWADRRPVGWLTLTSVFVHLQKVKMRPLHQCDFLFPSKTCCIQSDPCSATVSNKLHKNDGCL